MVVGFSNLIGRNILVDFFSVTAALMVVPDVIQITGFFYINALIRIRLMRSRRTDSQYVNDGHGTIISDRYTVGP